MSTWGVRICWIKLTWIFINLFCWIYYRVIFFSVSTEISHFPFFSLTICYCFPWSRKTLSCWPHMKLIPVAATATSYWSSAYVSNALYNPLLPPIPPFLTLLIILLPPADSVALEPPLILFLKGCGLWIINTEKCKYKMNIFFIFNYGEIQFYNKWFSRSKEKYIYFVCLNTIKITNNISSVLIFKQITQCFLLEYRTLLLCHSQFCNLVNFFNQLWIIGEFKLQFEAKECFLVVTVTSESRHDPNKGTSYSSQSTQITLHFFFAEDTLVFTSCPLPRETPWLLGLSLRSWVGLVCDANSYSPMTSS